MFLPEFLNKSVPPLMQLTCPNCSARYLVDPAAIGPTGRTVQCFRCGNKWRAPAAEAAADVIPPQVASVPDVIIRPQNGAATAALPAIPVDQGMPGWLKATIGLLVVVALVAAGGYLFRDAFIASLVIDQQTAKIDRLADEGGKTVIVISGDIVNTGRSEATATRLYLMFKDAQGNLVAERAVGISTGQIPPNGRSNFQARIEDAPAASVRVDLAAQ